jgi:hypothetical protein
MNFNIWSNNLEFCYRKKDKCLMEFEEELDTTTSIDNMHLSETFESPFLFDSRHGKFQ